MVPVVPVVVPVVPLPVPVVVPVVVPVTVPFRRSTVLFGSSVGLVCGFVALALCGGRAVYLFRPSRLRRGRPARQAALWERRALGNSAAGHRTRSLLNGWAAEDYEKRMLVEKENRKALPSPPEDPEMQARISSQITPPSHEGSGSSAGWARATHS